MSNAGELYVHLVEPGPRHGIDYHKGLEDGRACGRVHFVQTRKCHPVVFDEEQAASIPAHFRKTLSEARELFPGEDWHDFVAFNEETKL